MELRERVAKNAHEVLSRANVSAYLDMPDDTAFQVADAAIAAVLDAMGEPSEGMIQAAYTASVDYFVGDEVTGQGFRLAYAAMLAAFRTEALGEG